jgi:hypothetical protein
MSAAHPPREGRSVAELRREFDAAFTLPPAPAQASSRVLLVTVGETPLAVSVGDCAAVRREGDVTRLPSVHRGFVGVVAIAGAVLPVYDAAALLDLPDRPAARRGWLLVARTNPRACFRCDAIDGYADVPGGAAGADGTYALIHDVRRRVVSLASWVSGLEAELAADASNKE